MALNRGASGGLRKVHVLTARKKVTAVQSRRPQQKQDCTPEQEVGLQKNALKGQPAGMNNLK